MTVTKLKSARSKVEQTYSENRIIALCPQLSSVVYRAGKKSFLTRKHGPTADERDRFGKWWSHVAQGVSFRHRGERHDFRCTTKNPSNGAHGSHWAVTVPRKRSKQIGFVAGMAMWTPELEVAKAIRIRLTRLVCGGRLDAHDNLRSALKGFVDGLAMAFGKDDADPYFVWEYAQEPGTRGESWMGVEVMVVA